MAKSIYKANETMRIIGNQSICEYIDEGRPAHDDFRAVLEAHRQAESNNLFSVGMDFFMLGVMYGKKAERANKQHKAI